MTHCKQYVCATSERAGRMREHKMDGRHPGEPFVLTAFSGACGQIQGVDSPSAPRTKWDLYHSSHIVGRSTGKKEGTFNADVKADVQGDKE